jgi:hypothetical protein
MIETRPSMPPSPAWVVSAHLPDPTDAGLGRTPSRPKLHHASADQSEAVAEVELLRRLSFAQQRLLQARERSRVLLALAFAFAFARLVLPARRVLLRLLSRLSGRPGGSARWLPEESLPSREPAARDAGGMAGRRTRGQRRSTPGPRRGTAVLVWASSAIRPRVVPMRARAARPRPPGTGRDDEAIGPQGLQEKTEPSQPCQSPPRPNVGSMNSPCPHHQLAATEVRCLVAWRGPDRHGPHQPESRQRGIPATARAGRQRCGGGAASSL